MASLRRWPGSPNTHQARVWLSDSREPAAAASDSPERSRPTTATISRFRRQPPAPARLLARALVRHHAAKIQRTLGANAAYETGRRSRPPVRRRLIPIALGLVAAMAMLLGPLASQSQAATILATVPMDRCYPCNTSGRR